MKLTKWVGVLSICATAWLGSTSHAHAFGGSTGPCNTGKNTWTWGGGEAAGEKVTYYRPTQSGKRPTVIYLHGFSLPAPEIYKPHIDRLVALGYVVIFPAYNIVPTFFDLNQYNMLDRAIDAVDEAYAACSNYIDTNNVGLFGHSLGGNMAAAWKARGGQDVQRVFLANPSTDAGFVGFITTQLNHTQMAPQTTARVMILTGNQDTIAPSSQSSNLYNLMASAASRVVYQAVTTSSLKTDHMAPIQDDGWAPGWMMDIFGGRGTNDALDSQFYWPAFEAFMAGSPTYGFPVHDGFTVTTLNACAGACAL